MHFHPNPNHGNDTVPIFAHNDDQRVAIMSGVKRKEDSSEPAENAKKPRGEEVKEALHDLGKSTIPMRWISAYSQCPSISGGKKKASVSVFKGKALVNIREYYVDKATGEEKPGSKGIALTKEQWEALLAVVSTFQTYYSVHAITFIR